MPQSISKTLSQASYKSALNSGKYTFINIYNFIIITIISFLLMSPFGWSKYLYISGAYYPEILIIPLCFLTAAVNSNLIYRLLTNKSLLLWSVIISVLSITGIYFHGDMVAAYTDFRCLFAMYIAFYITKNMTHSRFNINLILYLLISNLVFFAFAYYMLPGIHIVEKYAFPIISVILVIYIAGLNGKFLIALLGFAVGIFLTIHSFYRQNFLIMIFCFASMIFAVPAARDPNGKSSKIRGLIFFASLAATTTAIPLVVSASSMFFRSNEGRYIQTIAKTRDLFAAIDGGSYARGADAIRLSYISVIKSHFLEFCLPGGLGQKALTNKWRSFWMPADNIIVGSSLDGLHLYLSAHFGIILTLIISMAYFIKLYPTLRNLRPAEIPVFLLTVVSLLLAIFFSSPTAQFGSAITFGIALAVLIRCPRVDSSMKSH